MRIALVHPYPWPEVRRGAERYLEDLATYLHGAGHDVIVVTSAPGGVACPAARRSDGVAVRSVRRRSGGRLARLGVGEVEWFGLEALPALLAVRADVVHALTPTAALAGRLAGRPTVYTVLGHPDRGELPQQFLPRGAFVQAVRRATVTTVLSEASAKALAAWSGVTAMVVPPGVRVDRFGPDRRVRTGPPRLLVSATLDDRRKRLDLVLGTLAVVLAHRPDARLALSGQGDPGPVLAEARRLGPAVADAVDVLGAGRPDEVAERYRGATVTVLAADHEAFGLALVESLACGTPVVCTPTGGMPEIVSDEVGRVAGASTPDALAAAVLDAVDLAGRPGTADRCVARAARWSWEQVGPRHEALYEAMCPRPERGRGRGR